ncbi:2OG-Fe dioxygenase family protein [Pseudomonas citronellolis]|uniref:2OG-Fe dioxygenase family protein n=1 Tax=Pseudomonas citronellolis TaxID=53408 RepID=UPI0023E42D17|nr:2OG-Fe dioxygenase family protein [Pseudomonas citronellolis]MDF3932509.1 2OG-Fe dioxygenase family protein [Pseudomonas citronellolis]
MSLACMELALSQQGVGAIGGDLLREGWSFKSGPDLARWFNLDEDTWASFAAFWENLALDEHMADQGTYRYRRYSEFDFQVGGPLRKLPHAPYEQPKYINSLNGGVPRQFLPLEDGFVEHPFFHALLAGMVRIFDGVSGARCEWNIRLHPYRIVTNELEQGKPTPEGRHRDGVDFIIMMLVRRAGVSGGVTRVSDREDRTLIEVMLSQGLDIIVADDRQVFHEVTPIDCAKEGEEGYRDALIVAFTRKDKPA